MATRLCVVAADTVKDEGTMSYAFMIRSEIPESFRVLSHKYGRLYLREKGENEVHPFKLVRGEPGAIGPDGKLKWQCHLGESGKQIFTGSVDEDLGAEEGLQSLLADMPDCILLVEKNILDRLRSASQSRGIQMDTHEFDGELQTHYTAEQLRQ